MGWGKQKKTNLGGPTPWLSVCFWPKGVNAQGTYVRSALRKTDRGYDSEVPGPVDVRIRAIDVVMFDPLDVWLKVAEHCAAERHCLADVRCLIARRLGDDRRVWKNR